MTVKQGVVNMYVIVHKESMALLQTKCNRRFKVNNWNSERSAKGWLTKMWNSGKLTGPYVDGEYVQFAKEDFIIMEGEEYKKVEPMVTRRNMMSGEEYQESINTPCFMSPSCESYWSM